MKAPPRYVCPLDFIVDMPFAIAFTPMPRRRKSAPSCQT